MLSATNANLDEEVKQGRLRQDLLFRLNTVEIPLPTLGERSEDVQPLAEHFLRLYTARYRKEISGFDPAALSTLRSHPFPGNVRELDHVVERAVLMARGKRIANC